MSEIRHFKGRNEEIPEISGRNYVLLHITDIQKLKMLS